jgi:hypothetical protein
MRVFKPLRVKEILDEFNSQEAAYAGADHRELKRELKGGTKGVILALSQPFQCSAHVR